MIEENARYTSMLPQSGVNDFTFAAEQTVHAVVHVKTRATVSSSYSYTADYEYTYGAKIKTTYNKTSLCSCGCGLEPEQFGAKRDW